MPDFRDSFTAREVCEGMLSQINVKISSLWNAKTANLLNLLAH